MGTVGLVYTTSTQPPTFRSYYTPTMEFKAHRNSDDRNSLVAYVSCINVIFDRKELVLDHVLRCDWKTFDDKSEHLSGLVLVNLAFGGREDMMRFCESVVDVHLCGLRNRGKLRYQVWDEKVKRWFYATPDSDVMRGT